MSLTLIQGYSSPEEEEEEEEEADEIDNLHSQNSSDENENGTALKYPNKPFFDSTDGASSSLPSALDAFAEVSGPPEFLNNCVEEPRTVSGGDNGQQWRHGRRRHRKEQKDLPSGVVVEAKPQLVGIHERVRSDVEGSTPASSVQPSSTSQGGKRVATVANPSAQDAAELLRMCLQCGVPKTFSNAKGMVCPICGDRPPADPNDESAKRKDPR